MQDRAVNDVVKEHGRLLENIGRVVVHFQLIELWVAEALAGLLDMSILEQRFLVAASMSFSQKVDLLCELFPRKRAHNFGVEMRLVRRALYSAEAFRNKIVHSTWAVSGDFSWVRTKGSLKGKAGFTIAEERVKSKELRECVEALKVIRDWEFSNSDQLLRAAQRLESGSA